GKARVLAHFPTRRSSDLPMFGLSTNIQAMAVSSPGIANDNSASAWNSAPPGASVRSTTQATRPPMMSVSTAVLTLIMGGLVAWVVERTDAPGGALFHALALLSFAIPGLLTAMAWIFVLSPNIGRSEERRVGKWASTRALP